MNKNPHSVTGAESRKKTSSTSVSVIDRYGFRLNVGIIIANQAKQVFWGKRFHGAGWQFPQGGIEPYETAEEAMFRELAEETGLKATEVNILQVTPKWYVYKLPRPLRHRRGMFCIGQRQKWFLLTLKNPHTAINLSRLTHPEFSDWKWIDYLEPIKEVIFFKRNVYKKVLSFFEPQIAQLAETSSDALKPETSPL